MREAVLHFFETFPPELGTFLVAMLPIVELRGAIPFAHWQGLSWQMGYVLSVAGNLVPIIPILLFLGPVSEWLRRLPGFGRFFDWLFHRTRRRGAMVERYEAIGLMLFVAVPLPITGAWTGAAAAFVFGLSFRRAFPAILAGVLIAGVVVTLAVEGIINLGGLVHGPE